MTLAGDGDAPPAMQAWELSGQHGHQRISCELGRKAETQPQADSHCSQGQQGEARPG